MVQTDINEATPEREGSMAGAESGPVVGIGELGSEEVGGSTDVGDTRYFNNTGWSPKARPGEAAENAQGGTTGRSPLLDTCWASTCIFLFLPLLLAST